MQGLIESRCRGRIHGQSSFYRETVPSLGSAAPLRMRSDRLRQFTMTPWHAATNPPVTLSLCAFMSLARVSSTSRRPVSCWTSARRSRRSCVKRRRAHVLLDERSGSPLDTDLERFDSQGPRIKDLRELFVMRIRTPVESANKSVQPNLCNRDSRVNSGENEGRMARRRVKA